VISRAGLTAALLLAVGACVPYVPRPVEPAAHPAEYRARRLDDPKLVEWVARWAARPEPRRWTDRQLALAALGLRAELERARADWRTAMAGERSAGARPQPGIEAGVERAVSGSEGQSPWVVSLAGLVGIELGGKRGARLQQARARTAVAEGDLRLTAWRIVQGARAAVAAVALAETELQQARREVEALAEVLTLERARYEEASLTLAELARTASEVQDARARAGATEAAALEARAELAGILALPVRALDSVVVTQDGESGCGSLDDLGPDSLIALTLHRRPEVGRVLAEYAVAEADLRLAVARQYPDLNLGPGFTWDQGVHRWTLALALPNLFGFRNRAAIDEADAARTAAAARVAELQDELLAEVELAMARCRGAMLERAAADSQMTAVRRAAELARAAYERGETSRLDPALAGLAVVRTERARQSAERRVLTAGQALDAASAGWSGGTNERWPDPRTDDLVEGAPE
jgi:outer membrane protein TolC